MDTEVEAWLKETVEKGTFASREDAVEFCVYATKAFCEHTGLTKKSILKQLAEVEENPPRLAEVMAEIRRLNPRAAEMLEKTAVEDILFPVKLDDAWKAALHVLGPIAVMNEYMVWGSQRSGEGQQ